MLEIKVCVGSSCHIKGAYNIIQELQNLLKEMDIEDDVELKADFCQGNCREAVCVKIGDNHLTNVTPSKLPGILAKYCLIKE